MKVQTSEVVVNKSGDVEDVRPDLNALEQLVNLFVRHLLTELGEHVSQLPSTNVTVSFLIKDLKTADKLLYNQWVVNDISLRQNREPSSRTRGAGRLEPIDPVQNRQKVLIIH